MSMFTWRDWREAEDIRELENLREGTSYAIQSQYSASQRIMALAAGFQDKLDPHIDIDLFYQKIFDIHTAEGFGLDNWGVILGIGRNIPGPYTGDCFGLDGSELHPFDQYPFVPDNGTPPAITMINLDDEHFRLLLLYKALANISASDAETQNRLLSVLINSGVAGFPKAAYVLEVGKMVIRWVFERPLSAIQGAVFKAAGTLARGAGVGWELYALDPRETFGFDGSEMRPFLQAPFAGDNALIINDRS
jgi:hypothetical protein